MSKIDLIKLLRNELVTGRTDSGLVASASPENIAALLDHIAFLMNKIDWLIAEKEELRNALLPFVDDGVQLVCDECGGDPEKCESYAPCLVRKGRAAMERTK